MATYKQFRLGELAPAQAGFGLLGPEALRLMQDGGFRHVPMANEAGNVIGIVSRSDFRGLEQDRLDEETGYWERI